MYCDVRRPLQAYSQSSLACWIARRCSPFVSAIPLITVSGDRWKQARICPSCRCTRADRRTSQNKENHKCTHPLHKRVAVLASTSGTVILPEVFYFHALLANRQHPVIPVSDATQGNTAHTIDAFLGLFTGENLGKQVVQVAERYIITVEGSLTKGINRIYLNSRLEHVQNA